MKRNLRGSIPILATLICLPSFQGTDAPWQDGSIFLSTLVEPRRVAPCKSAHNAMRNLVFMLLKKPQDIPGERYLYTLRCQGITHLTPFLWRDTTRRRVMTRGKLSKYPLKQRLWRILGSIDRSYQTTYVKPVSHVQLP